MEKKSVDNFAKTSSSSPLVIFVEPPVVVSAEPLVAISEVTDVSEEESYELLQSLLEVFFFPA